MEGREEGHRMSEKEKPDCRKCIYIYEEGFVFSCIHEKADEMSAAADTPGSIYLEDCKYFEAAG